MNASRLSDYASVRAEITSYIEARVGVRMKTGSSNTKDPNAMDIGSMGGQNSRFEGTCSNCGKKGSQTR